MTRIITVGMLFSIIHTYRYSFHERNLLWMYDNETEAAFSRKFCMKKDTFDALHDDLSQVIPRGQSTNGRSFLQQEKLLTFLHSTNGMLPENI